MQLPYVELPSPAGASGAPLEASGPLLVGFGALLPGEILLLVLDPRRRQRVPAPTGRPLPRPLGRRSRCPRMAPWPTR